MGDRWSNPLDQWPDPEVYIHYPSGQYLAYMDARNLNRDFPGRADGTLTERTTFAFMELIRVGIIQGQELSGPFKSMAEMMRERLELDIIEAGQRAGIQVTVITSGFIVVATLIVAVGPAVQTLMGSGLF